MPVKNIAPATFELLATVIGLPQFSIQCPYQRIFKYFCNVCHSLSTVLRNAYSTKIFSMSDVIVLVPQKLCVTQTCKITRTSVTIDKQECIKFLVTAFNNKAFICVRKCKFLATACYQNLLVFLQILYHQTSLKHHRPLIFPCCLTPCLHTETAIRSHSRILYFPRRVNMQIERKEHVFYTLCYNQQVLSDKASDCGTHHSHCVKTSHKVKSTLNTE